MKKTTLIVLAAIVIASSVGIVISVRQIPKSPVQIMEQFYNAYNEQDLNTLVTCLDPQVENAYTTLNSTLGTLLGIGFQDIANLAAAFESLGLAGNSRIDPDQIDVISVKYTGSRIGNWAANFVEKIYWLGNLAGQKAQVSISYPDISAGSIAFVELGFSYFDEFGWRIVSGSIDYRSNTLTES